MIKTAKTFVVDNSLPPNGYSPGGAAAELGVTRQCIHQAMRDGRLDAYHIPVPGERSGYYFIPEASLDAFKLLRKARRGSS